MDAHEPLGCSVSPDMLQAIVPEAHSAHPGLASHTPHTKLETLI